EYNQSADSNQEIECQPTLRAGIYLLLINPDLGLVIQWPEIGCYKENASSQKKKNMTNLHRYLTKLTDNQICFMSENDLENFEFDAINKEQDSCEKNNMCYEFEVKKSQEEKEDFKLFPGFIINLPLNMKKNLENCADIETPMVVDSIYNQTLITRKMITLTSVMRKHTVTSSFNTFKQEFQSPRSQRFTLEISRNMSMKSLEILVKYGLNMEEEMIGPLKNAIAIVTKKSDLKKEHEMLNLKMNAEYFTVISQKLLKELYSEFELLVCEKLTETLNSQIVNTAIGNINLKYPNIQRKIENAVQINSHSWKELKYRYYVFTTLITKFAVEDKHNKHNVEIIYLIFKSLPLILKDEENNLQKLFVKYFEAQKGILETLVSFFTVTSDDAPNLKLDEINIKALSTRATELLNSQDDSCFIQNLFRTHLFDSYQEIKKSVINIFLDEYLKWRKTFVEKIKDIVPDQTKEITCRLEDELTRLIRDLEKNEFEKICQNIEEKYPKDKPKFRILNIDYCGFPRLNSIRFTFENETIQSDQLQINIYETSLDQSDTFELQEKELHVPNPMFSMNNNHEVPGISFQIDPVVYDIRKLSQFENKKFFLILWNKKQKRYETFFDIASRLNNIFNSDSPKPFKKLNAKKDCLFAINEPRGLIGIYDTKSGVLNVYVFDDMYERLLLRNPNIQILQWYNFSAPDIQHFFFIKDTEEICFVEMGGRARIYNLINGQFRPGIGHIPANANIVVSTPDGTCIVAFVKGELQTEQSFKDSMDIDKHSVTNEEKYFAHIYFCSNFRSPVKVIEMPSTMKSPEYFQFSLIQKRQIHLTTLDLEKYLFCSSIIKITHEKTQYRFQQRFRKSSLGQARLCPTLQSNYLSMIEGNNTNFTKDIHEGDNIILSGEKYRVKEIISDKILKIPKSNLVESNNWMEFQIERKINHNGLIDVYKLTFEKYQVDSCVDSEAIRPLSLQIALDIHDSNQIKNYEKNFKDYVSEMFDELKRTTKKPSTSLKKFTVAVSTFNNFDIDDFKFKQESSTEYQLGEWIIQLSVLIPIQIAVARNNLFIPLRDGLSSETEQGEPEDEYAIHIDAIAQNISFGWYEGIFKYFGNRQVKVISSMGEQSCGKSYMLNHLIGTTFDGSAMRCTEGVWMSLVITKKYLYVALDFEGLKSLERTPQEGMTSNLFLTMFNTVVSNMILFKNQFAVNRDMSIMFQRFQDSAFLFESDPKIFQAKLCIIIKDVPKQDRDDIVREFSLKFNSLVAE
ncbi:7739_t:CDS:10, partial [Scutellospora calospora]